jgi:hypothetical protein
MLYLLTEIRGNLPADASKGPEALNRLAGSIQKLGAGARAHKQETDAVDDILRGLAAGRAEGEMEVSLMRAYQIENVLSNLNRNFRHPK